MGSKAPGSREFLSASISPETLNAENRTVDVVFFTSPDIPRHDWMTGADYILRFNPSGADLSLLNNGAPIFDNHPPLASAADQKGVVEKAWRKDTDFLASLRFSKRAEVDGLWQDIADKIVQKFSMGVNILAKQELAQEKGKLRVVEVTQWQPFEISTAPLPADNNSHALSEERERNMPAISLEERGTAHRLIDLCPQGDRARLAALVDAGASLVELRKAACDAQAAAAGPEVRGNAEITRDARETLALRMGEAVASRYTGRPPSDAAREFMSGSLVEMARECLAASGQRARMISSSEVIRLALASTSDFPALLTEGGKRMLLASYEAASPQIKRCARTSTAQDFRTKSLLRLSEAPELLEVNESGEVKSGARSESKESYKLRTFARIFGITRQALVNDDLGAFADSARAFGIAGATLEGRLLTALLVSNPKMATDNQDLFHADHSNLSTGAGSAFGVPGLTAARLLLRSQTGMDGSTILDIAPAVLLVPAALETTAQQGLAAIFAAVTSNVNPFSGSLTLAVDPRLDADSTAKWYLFADPAGPFPVLEYSYLSGQEGLAIESRVGFEVEGLEVKARLDFGVGAVDFRGAVRSNGS